MGILSTHRRMMNIDGLNAVQIMHAGRLGAADTYRDKVIGYNPIAYWMQAEAAGLVAIDEINSPLQDGAYTGVTLGQPGIGDGQTCPLFDGTNDYNNVQTATFAAAFDGKEGTLLVWARVSGVGVWSDAASRYAWWCEIDDRNIVFLAKSATNQRFVARYRASNGTTTWTIDGLITTDWMCWALTWSDTANEGKCYLDGVQQGLTAPIGSWEAGDLTLAVIGARSIVPADPWDGYLAHVAIWDVALGQPAITDLATV